MVCAYVVEVCKIPADNLTLLGNCYLYVNNVKFIFQEEVWGLNVSLAICFLTEISFIKNFRILNT